MTYENWDNVTLTMFSDKLFAVPARNHYLSPIEPYPAEFDPCSRACWSRRIYPRRYD